MVCVCVCVMLLIGGGTLRVASCLTRGWPEEAIFRSDKSERGVGAGVSPASI